MKVFVSGGCKNGKSSFAEKISKAISKDNFLYYIATMNPVDTEDEERILRHQKNREGLDFKTIECFKDIINITNKYESSATFLLDSVTALLANEMFEVNGVYNSQVYFKVANDISSVISFSKNIIIVSDYIYSDSTIYDEYTENYRKGLAYIDKVCAKECDVVVEAVFGSIIYHKGRELMEHLT